MRAFFNKMVKVVWQVDFPRTPRRESEATNGPESKHDEDLSSGQGVKAAGTLEQYCREAEDRAEQAKIVLIQQGWRDYEADEIARDQMLKL